MSDMMDGTGRIDKIYLETPAFWIHRRALVSKPFKDEYLLGMSTYGDGDHESLPRRGQLTASQTHD